MIQVIERDLTTPRGINAELRRLQLLIGTSHAHACIVLNGGDCKENLSLDATWCASGQKDEKIGRVEGDTFAEMIANAEQMIANWKVTRRETVIRKMSLAIIELTDEHTHCTVALLRGKGFSEADITLHQDAACTRAGEMCGNAPFVVLP